MFSSFVPINKSALYGTNFDVSSTLSVTVAIISSMLTSVPASTMYSFLFFPALPASGSVIVAGVVSTTVTCTSLSIEFPAASVKRYLNLYTPSTPIFTSPFTNSVVTSVLSVIVNSGKSTNSVFLSTSMVFFHQFDLTAGFVLSITKVFVVLLPDLSVATTLYVPSWVIFFWNLIISPSLVKSASVYSVVPIVTLSRSSSLIYTISFLLVGFVSSTPPIFGAVVSFNIFDTLFILTFKFSFTFPSVKLFTLDSTLGYFSLASL